LLIIACRAELVSAPHHKSISPKKTCKLVFQVFSIFKNCQKVNIKTGLNCFYTSNLKFVQAFHISNGKVFV